MSPLDRAKDATEAAERAAEAGDLRTAQAYRASAAAWERVSRPGVFWSQQPLRQQLAQLKRELAVATGPFQPPAPPKAPPPAALRPDPEKIQRQLGEIAAQARREAATIEF